MSYPVFTVPIEGVSLATCLQMVREATSPQWIVTANPENLLEARKDVSYAKVLQQADVRTVDGFGLWACLRLVGNQTQRVTGVTLAEALLDEAQRHGYRVGFFGGEAGEAEEAMKRLQQSGRYPTVSFCVEAGGRVDRDGKDDDPSASSGQGEEARYRMTMFDPQIVFVALSFPGQERWIQEHMGEFPSLRAIVGIGGTFNFWSGAIKRAPGWMRSVGLEWLWRLMQEPRRIGRIFRAVIVFPVVFLADRLTNK